MRSIPFMRIKKEEKVPKNHRVRVLGTSDGDTVRIRCNRVVFEGHDFECEFVEVSGAEISDKGWPQVRTGDFVSFKDGDGEPYEVISVSFDEVWLRNSVGKSFVDKIESLKPFEECEFF